MSIAPNTLERGVAARFRQPLNEDDEREARNLVYAVHYINCEIGTGPRLRQVMYRNSTDDIDMVRHVYRFDRRGYADVFQNGFQAWDQGHTSDADYYNLLHHVNNGGTPLDPNAPVHRAFVSTTVNSSWRPVNANLPRGTSVFRYEIFAPGGILVNETLEGRYNFVNQREVAFVGGIAPQYIRAAVEYVVADYDIMGRAIFQWADNEHPRIHLNINFNPQSHPQDLMRIQNPMYSYKDPNASRRRAFIISIWRGHQQKQWRDNADLAADDLDSLALDDPPMGRLPGGPPSDPFDFKGWYTRRVFNIDGYINAAFRTSKKNQAYLFMRNEYVLVDYAPGTTKDRVLEGPAPISEGIPCLADTDFGDAGIDCAFGGHYFDEAFVFCSSMCAHINYKRGVSRIISGPMPILEMFPFFENTIFEKGVDAAFEANARDEAYLFKGTDYVLINYKVPRQISEIKPIEGNWGGLTGNLFQYGIEAAFASHRKNEAYIFKGDIYALINFSPGNTNDYIVNGPKPIIPENWPCLAQPLTTLDDNPVPVLPRKNRGLDPVL